MSLLEKISVGKRQQPPRLLIYGSEGSGKSTFLRCLNHLETIDRGFIAI